MPHHLLEKHITSVLDKLVGRQLSAYFFYESEPDYLSTNPGKIDIIGFQIELVFDTVESIFGGGIMRGDSGWR
ncbi:hypothetical protein [Hymenobacter rubripertinctus]|uniref:hypothetical protein n=1 Tax=Hymenobacter rubripertinctus TaxID=2029981 RepID=UPI0011C37992|nr:hypothetical protein [Hymenobacter rubripertinctus]